MKKLPEVFGIIKNEAKSYQMLRSLRWGKRQEIVCVYCQGKACHRHGGKRLNRRYHCQTCRRTFTDLTDTIFARSKIPLWQWLYAIFEFGQKKGISAAELSIKLRISYPAAWRLLHKIREVLVEESAPHTLKGVVEVDEAWTTREIVQGIVERSGEVAIEIVENIEEATLQRQIFDKVVPGSQVLSDGRVAYSGLAVRYRHGWVNHSKHYVDPDTGVHTNTIEAVWSHLKRLLGTIYHGVSRKHLKKYLAEFMYRYNHRHLSNPFSHLLSLTLSPRYCLY